MGVQLGIGLSVSLNLTLDLLLNAKIVVTTGLDISLPYGACMRYGILLIIKIII